MRFRLQLARHTRWLRRRRRVAALLSPAGTPSGPKWVPPHSEYPGDLNVFPAATTPRQPARPMNRFPIEMPRMKPSLSHTLLVGCEKRHSPLSARCPDPSFPAEFAAHPCTVAAAHHCRRCDCNGERSAAKLGSQTSCRPTSHSASLSCLAPPPPVVIRDKESCLN